MNGASPYNPYTPSLYSAIRGPIMLITIGSLAALDHFTPYSWSETWPVLIIVFGLLKLIEKVTRPPIPPYAAPPPGSAPLGGRP